MNADERKYLSQEVEMQTQALRKIALWKNCAIAVSTIGMALLYAGIAGAVNRSLFCILGIIIMAVGLFCGLIINLGLKNGRRNVEKMLVVLKGE